MRRFRPTALPLVLLLVAASAGSPQPPAHPAPAPATAPGLVIAGGNNFTHADDIARLRDLGIPVIVVYAADVPGVLADINLVGKAVGEEQAATGIVGAIQARIDEVTAAVAGLDRPRT